MPRAPKEGEEMAKLKDLIAVDVHTDDVGDYNVTEPGWAGTWQVLQSIDNFVAW